MKEFKAALKEIMKVTEVKHIAENEKGQFVKGIDSDRTLQSDFRKEGIA